MAKIVHKGMWIDIKSLNPDDKKNFLTSLVFGFIASIFGGCTCPTLVFLETSQSRTHGFQKLGFFLLEY